VAHIVHIGNVECIQNIIQYIWRDKPLGKFEHRLEKNIMLTVWAKLN
jgi:hypothetical protein